MELTNKRILVTGGNGFLGKHLVRKLEPKNPKEIIITNSKNDDLDAKVIVMVIQQHLNRSRGY